MRPSRRPLSDWNWLMSMAMGPTVALWGLAVSSWI
jgi:hypothetical protein